MYISILKRFFPALLCLLMAACAHLPAEQTHAAKAADIALTMRDKPYHFGGTSPRGFDCSGLVYYSYSHAGMKVPRSTQAQRRASTQVTLADMRKGDLVFFNERGRRASHVGIYLGHDTFIHAPSSGQYVRLEKLSNPYWHKHFTDARRFD